MSALAAVEAQLAAFNAHDVEGFLATYAEDAVVTGAAPDALHGHDDMRAHYARRLEGSRLRCEVDAVVVFADRWVVAHEAVSDGEQITEVVATFEVVDGRIARASMLRAAPVQSSTP